MKQSLSVRRLYYASFLLLPVVSFGCFYLVYDWVLVRERDLPCCFFVFGREFLSEFTDHPGGLLTWAGRFACQFAHRTWSGAAAVSLCVSLFGLLLHLVLVRRGGRLGILGTFLPCLLLLVLHTLTLRIMMDAIGIVVACAALLGYLRLRKDTVRRAYALVLTPVLYVVLGGYVWLFVLWVTALAWEGRKPLSGLLFKVLYPLLSTCLPLVAYARVFPISLRSAWAHNAVFASAVPRGHVPIVVSLFAYLLFMPFWPMLASRAGGWLPKRWRTDGHGRAVAVTTACVLVLSTTLLVRAFRDPASRELADHVLMYEARDWDGILARAGEKPSNLLLVQFLVNRALYEKGMLLEDLFRYRQKWGSCGLVLQGAAVESGVSREESIDTVLAMYNSDLFFEMGHVNMAYRQAYNQVSLIGPTHRAYRRLAECHMVNGRYEAAGKYLTLLEKSVFHRGFARRYKAILAHPAAADALFAEARARRPTVELHTVTLPWTAFQELVTSGRTNRMALEYLVAWHLLDRGSASVIAGNVRDFEAAGYTRLPRHVQEALYLQEVMGKMRVDLREYSYDRDVTARFRAFESRMASLQGDPAALSKLRWEFGDTYLLFFITDRSGTYNNASSYRRLGNELLSNGMRERAVLHYRLALKYDPGDSRAREDLHKALAGEAIAGE